MSKTNHAYGPCPHCRTQVYVTSSDGALVCENGHQSQTYYEEMGDDAPSYSFKIQRRLKKGQAHQSTLLPHEVTMDPFFIYDCYQHILQVQLDAMYILMPDLPCSFAETVKEFWLLYMTLLEEKQGLIGRLGSSDMEQTDAMHNDSVEPLIGNSTALEEQENEAAEARQVTTSVTDTKAPFLETLATLRFKRASLNREWISLQMRSLAVLMYLSCLYCHVPVLLSDLHRWTLQGKIPYLAAYTSLPEEAKSKLAKSAYRKYEFMIRPRSLPHLLNWYQACEHIKSLFETDYQIIFPLPSVPVILYNFVTGLYLPVQVHYLTLKVIEWSEFDVERLGKGLAPESLVMAYVVFVVKMFWGLNESNNDQDRDDYFEQFLPLYRYFQLLWHQKFPELHPWQLATPDTLTKTELDDYLQFCASHVIPSSTHVKNKFQFLQTQSSSLLWREGLEKISTTKLGDRPSSPPMMAHLFPSHTKPFRIKSIKQSHPACRYISYKNRQRSEIHADYATLLHVASRWIGRSEKSLQILVMNLEQSLAIKIKAEK